MNTKIIKTEETGSKIASEFFDFYDHSELKPFANQTTYMIGDVFISLTITITWFSYKIFSNKFIITDVVGIIRDHKILLNDITNRLGQRQVQAKFAITDGR